MDDEAARKMDRASFLLDKTKSSHEEGSSNREVARQLDRAISYAVEALSDLDSRRLDDAWFKDDEARRRYRG